METALTEPERTRRFATMVFTRVPILELSVVDFALAFSLRPSSSTLLTTFRAWHMAHTAHQNARVFAAEYHSTQLQYRMLLVWRVRLRASLKMVKQARMAHKFITARMAWTVWANKFQERRREKALKEFENRKLKKSFVGDYKHFCYRRENLILAL